MYVYFDVDERSLLRYMRERDESRSTDPGSLRELGIDCYRATGRRKRFPAQRKVGFCRKRSQIDHRHGALARQCLKTKMTRWPAACLFECGSRRASPIRRCSFPSARWPPIRTSNSFMSSASDGIATAAHRRTGRPAWRHAHCHQRPASRRASDRQRIAAQFAPAKRWKRNSSNQNCTTKHEPVSRCCRSHDSEHVGAIVAMANSSSIGQSSPP